MLMVRGRRKGGTAGARGPKTAESSDIEIDFSDKKIRVRVNPESDAEATQKQNGKPPGEKKPN